MTPPAPGDHRLVELDRNGLEVLSRPECLALLGSATIGRVGLSMDALPVVLPVHFVLDHEQVVIGTAAGSKLDAALAGAVVAFQVDSVEEELGVAWSVLVRGSCHVVDDLGDGVGEDLARRRRWFLEHCDRWISISTDLVSGRRMPEPGQRAALEVPDLHEWSERPTGRSVPQRDAPAQPGSARVDPLQRRGAAQSLGARPEVA